MQPKHVKEAFRLLNKSIIRVETPDVNLDQEDVEEEPAQEGINGECSMISCLGLVMMSGLSSSNALLFQAMPEFPTDM